MAVSDTPSASQDAVPEPSFHDEGATRVLTYGDLEVRATPNKIGVYTAISVTNRYRKPASYEIKISVADGAGWVAHNNFRIQDVQPGTTGRDATVIGGEHLGPIPQRPKIYVDQYNPIINDR